MDFGLTKSQQEIKKAARDFAKGEFDKDYAQELDQSYGFPDKIWKNAADLGFIGIHFPERFSGQGLGVLENVLIAESFCTMDSTIGCALILSGYGAECILRFGSDPLKETCLPPIAEGKALSAGAFTEPEFASNVHSTAATATLKGDDWVIRGTKKISINGKNADYYMVLGLSPAEWEAPNPRANMILVESDRKGLSYADVDERMGNRMMTAAEVTFDDVRVPAGNLIGKEGKGLSQLESFLEESRIVFAGLSLGTAQGAFNRSLDYVKQREQFGQKIVRFQVTQHKLADMATKIELARLITYKAASCFDQSKEVSPSSSMAKLCASRAAVEVADEAIQLHGGYGYMVEYEVERFFRDAKSLELLEGTREIQKDDIARTVIGKTKS